ncbi:hypothetical protein C1H46_002930 [Malus baccata]|uniref:Coenzyme Q-binding protein COQ10 START domain-containing protein n=1 Tax=Malus baccata TaxID=106549 RepID=A0A540NKL2_MALBA|nr:hypothetical protein C1H46_002930 [Malus baccata]
MAMMGGRGRRGNQELGDLRIERDEEIQELRQEIELLALRIECLEARRKHGGSKRKKHNQRWWNTQMSRFGSWLEDARSCIVECESDKVNPNTHQNEQMVMPKVSNLKIGEQKLALGLKFNAKGIVDCYETPLETLPNNFGHKRDIRFNMVEGDFEIFQGKWSLQQKHPHPQQQQQVQVHTSLSYMVDVKPKMWLPVRLVEGRLCKEIKLNLACIRQEALKLTHHNTTARQ